ncbi:FG-GAP repeat domain-containing protein [Microbulbifer taiwanensis]|uniref:FG-GAP repeat domain-containing protein n=1 Tax=Microbulbifer taiwanensis TaxID=986746 RepID=UPI003607BD2A
MNRDTVLELSRSLIAAAGISEIANSFWISVDPGSSSPKESKNGSGGGKVTVEVKSTGSSSSEVIIGFNDFTEEGVTVNGRIVQNVERHQVNQDGSYYTYISGDQSFENFTLETSEESFLLHGSVEGAGPESRQQQLSLILADEAENQQLKLQDFSIDKTLVSGYPYSYFDTEVSGTLYDSAQGKITISTERPMAEFGLEDNRNYWRGRRNGLIRFEGEGEGEGGLFGLSGTYATLLLDEDGDGQLETGTRVTWELLNNSESFVWQNNNLPPVSNPGESISSRERLDTFLHGLYSHDPDGNFLSYRWELVAKPAGSAFELENPRTPYFTFQPDLAGDYVFNLHVSDGENHSRSTSSVTVWENLTNETYSVEQLHAGLEVNRLDTAQPAFALDATSGIDGPFDEGDVDWSASSGGIGRGETGLEENNHTPHNTVSSLSSYGHIFTASASGPDFYSSTTINSGDVPIAVSARLAGAYGFQSESAAAADLNGDDVPDIVSLYKVDNTQFESEIFVNKGDGTFTRKESVSAGNKFLVTGDLNRDGRPDIASSDNESMVVAIQDGQGDFSTVERLAFPESPATEKTTTIPGISPSATPMAIAKKILSPCAAARNWKLSIGRKEIAGPGKPHAFC